jgi:hypothetical protein
MQSAPSTRGAARRGLFLALQLRFLRSSESIGHHDSEIVDDGLSTPEQIAGWLKRAHPEDECYRVSHETISEIEAGEQ